VVGVNDRLEIWDRDAHERYVESFGGAYLAGSLLPGRRP
jgi:DNA-binding transcriptional regulator/RsmH inhibitor MraZ